MTMDIEIISATARAIVENAERLGLTWTMRMATVTNVVQVANSNFIPARYDGDDASINMVNMTEVPLESGARVYAIRVPPSGNFIIASADATPMGFSVYNNIAAGDPSAGGTTSSSYADMPGPMDFTVYKKYLNTKLLLGMSGTWFDASGSAGTSVDFAIEVAGASYGDGDYEMTQYVATLPAGVVRLPIPAAERMVAVGNGLITLTARFRRSGGAGTPSVATADFLYMKAQEVWGLEYS